MLFPEDESSLGDLVLIGQSTLSSQERQPPSVVVAVLEYSDHDTVILGGATNPHREPTIDEDCHSCSSCGDEGFSYMEQLLFDFNNLACFNSHRSRKDTSGNNNHNHNHNNSNSSSSSSCLLMDYDFVSSTNMMIPKEDKVYRRKYADI